MTTHTSLKQILVRMNQAFKYTFYLFLKGSMGFFSIILRSLVKLTKFNSKVTQVVFTCLKSPNPEKIC